ncbi:MAG TPA: hypothetical protein VGK17_17090 [Propionicimonas sp.]
MKRPRAASQATKVARRAAGNARRARRSVAPDPDRTRRAVRGARIALAITVAGWAVAVIGAAWFARQPVDELSWGIAIVGRGSGPHRPLFTLVISRSDLVALAGLVTALPVGVAVVGLLRTPPNASEGRRAAILTSVWSFLAVWMTYLAVPNVLGCYAASLAGATGDLALLPMWWPQGSLIVLFLAAMVWSAVSAWQDKRHGRRPRRPRTAHSSPR